MEGPSQAESPQVLLEEDPCGWKEVNELYLLLFTDTVSIENLEST